MEGNFRGRCQPEQHPDLIPTPASDTLSKGPGYLAKALPALNALEDRKAHFSVLFEPDMRHGGWCMPDEVLQGTPRSLGIYEVSSGFAEGEGRGGQTPREPPKLFSKSARKHGFCGFWGRPAHLLPPGVGPDPPSSPAPFDALDIPPPSLVESVLAVKVGVRYPQAGAEAGGGRLFSPPACAFLLSGWPDPQHLKNRTSWGPTLGYRGQEMRAKIETLC